MLPRSSIPWTTAISRAPPAATGKASMYGVAPFRKDVLTPWYALWMSGSGMLKLNCCSVVLQPRNTLSAIFITVQLQPQSLSKGAHDDGARSSVGRSLSATARATVGRTPQRGIRNQRCRGDPRNYGGGRLRQPHAGEHRGPWQGRVAGFLSG